MSRIDHNDKEHVSRWPGIPQEGLTAFNRRAIGLLCSAYGTGPWNIPVNWERVDWNYGSGTAFVLNCWGHGLASFDTNRLTRLVIGAHEECIRVEVGPKAFRYLEIAMWPRQREGGLMISHPTIEEAVERYRR